MADSPRPYEHTPARDDVPTIARWARIALTLVLIPIGLSAFGNGWIPVLSDLDLAVHEFGHRLFMPFGIMFAGRTAVILGGSLFQVVFPLIFLAYFLRPWDGKKRDVHAAMVCLWWSAINLVNVAIYCADARAGQLMLLNGATGEDSDFEGHDWHMLLSHWHALNKDTVIAARMRGTAWLMFGAAIVIGLMAAWRSGRSPNDDARSTR